MTSHSGGLKIWLWIATSFYLILHFLNRGLSLSYDMPEHYELVYYLQHYWHLPTGTLLAYLPNAYVVAAILGTFLGSPFFGMQWTLLISALAIWSLLGFALTTLPRRSFCFTSILLFALLLINYHHLNLFTNEIVRNFFFPQFFAQAIVTLFFVLALSWEKKEVNPLLIYLLLSAGVLLAENTHLLPAVELFGFLTLLILLDNYLIKKISFAIKSGALLLLMLVAIIINPAFNAMRLISTNNGALALRHIHSLKSLSVVCVLVGLLSVFLIIKWLKHNELRKNCLVLKYFGLFGLTISTLCILQIILLQLGQGSEYACRKYAFGLNTFLLINLSLAVSITLKPQWLTEITNPNIPIQIFQYIFVPLLLLIVFFLGPLHFNKYFNVSDIVRLEQVISSYRNTVLQEPPKEKYDYAIGLNDHYPATIDSMISRIILGAPPLPDKNMNDILMRTSFTEPQKVRFLFTLKGKMWDIPSCRKHILYGSIVLLDGHCVLQELNTKPVIP